MGLSAHSDPVYALLLYLPAMAANGAPVVLKRMEGRLHPIDFNLRLWDGRPLFGRGKTWEGFLVGLAAGGFVGIIIYILTECAKPQVLALYVPLGALLGDIAGSFLKRRIGLERGAPLPILDQLDFYIGANIAAYASGALPAPEWILVYALVIYGLHRATNLAAYKLGLKDVPW